jgi:hypothetical protein
LPDDPVEAELELRREMNASYGRRVAVVKVKDRFGDYGVVGFWMMDGVWGNSYLIHFAFSCRTIGMGVEQWVYHRLGKPYLKIVGEVVAELDFDPDWINMEGQNRGGGEADQRAIRSVRLRGGCELEVMKHFFGVGAKYLHSELVYMRGIQTVWNSNVTTLFPSDNMNDGGGRAVLARIGLTPEDFRTQFLDDCDQHTLLVLSNSFDPFAKLYRHRALGFIVPIFVFGTEHIAELSEEQLSAFFERVNYGSAQKAQFMAIRRELSENYALVEQPFDYLDELYHRLVTNVPQNALLVFLLPPTFAPRVSGAVVMQEQIEINTRIRNVSEGKRNVRVVDMADSVTSITQMQNYSNLHFHREAYHDIYLAITKTYSEWLAAELPGKGPLEHGDG